MPSNKRPRQMLKSTFNRGWTPQRKAMVDAVVLPKQLRCYECDKLLHVSGFSEKQCRDLRHGIVNGQVKSAKLNDEAWVRCRKCTGLQPTEMECIICEEVKGYDDFSKAQRKDPDHAKCLACVYDIQVENTIERTAAEAYGGSQYDDDSDSEGTSNVHEDSEFDESEAGGASLSTYELSAFNLKNLNISTGSHSPGPSASLASAAISGPSMGRVSGATNMAGVPSWQAMNKRNARSTADSISGARFTGYDPSGGAHQRVRAPSTVASNDSEETTTAEPNYDAKALKEANSKFARLRGPRKELVKPATGSGRTMKKYESDDDDDDDEDEDDWFTI